MFITQEDIISYTGASMEIATKCAELWKKDYKIMLVPSRGAHPFVDNAKCFHSNCLRFLDKQSENYKNLNSQTSLNNQMYLPFTSDFGNDTSSNLLPKTIRNFWVSVTKSIVENDKETSFYKFFRYIRDNIVKIGHHDYNEAKFNSEKFIFIDTVISGQAVVEISDEFNRIGMSNIQYIFIIDENGKKIKKEFKEKIFQLEKMGRAHLIYVDRLFTEDQGPAISGIWSIVLPELMEVAQEEIPSFNDAVGAGLYYWEVTSRKRNNNPKSHLPDNTFLTSSISKMSTLLFSGISLMPIEKDIKEYLEILKGSSELKIKKENFHFRNASSLINYQIEQYNEHINSTKNSIKRAIFDPVTTKILSEQEIINKSTTEVKVDISSSHCLRASMSKDSAFKIIKDFKENII